MTSLDEFIKEINRLKPMPAITTQLLKVVNDSGSSMADIASVIKYDPIITAGILKSANSAYFGLKNPVESIRDAVNLLGTEKVVELALMKSGAEALSGKQEGYDLEKGEMWKYSVSSAMIAKQLAEKRSLKNTHMIFTSALLKDIGKVILEKHVLSASKKITSLVKQKGYSFLEAEKKAFGINHAELGAMIAKKWNFSPKMIHIIRHHHLADKKMKQNKAICVVYLADCICMMMGIGVGADGLAYRFKRDVMKDLKITAEDISLIIAEFGCDMQKIQELLEIN